MHGAAAARPEPSSKLLEQYAEGGELREAKEMGHEIQCKRSTIHRRS
jgi:hypothetical protein